MAKNDLEKLCDGYMAGEVTSLSAEQCAEIAPLIKARKKAGKWKPKKPKAEK